MRRARLWSTGTELAAQAVELLSVLASERRIRAPREVPRPEWADARERSGAARSGTAHAVAVLRQTRRRVRVS